MAWKLESSTFVWHSFFDLKRKCLVYIWIRCVGGRKHLKDWSLRPLVICVAVSLKTHKCICSVWKTVDMTKPSTMKSAEQSTILFAKCSGVCPKINWSSLFLNPSDWQRCLWRYVCCHQSFFSWDEWVCSNQKAGSYFLHHSISAHVCLSKAVVCDKPHKCQI